MLQNVTKKWQCGYLSRQTAPIPAFSHNFPALQDFHHPDKQKTAIFPALSPILQLGKIIMSFHRILFTKPPGPGIITATTVREGLIFGLGTNVKKVCQLLRQISDGG